MPTAFAIRTAALIVRHGGVIAYPTEGVYGLGCDPYDADALERLLVLKRRAAERGLILIAATVRQLEPFIEPLAAAARRKIEAAQPVTWLVPAARNAPPSVTGRHTTVAVRITHHPVARALCERCDQALVSTSANLAGRAPARTALGVRQRFGDAIDYVLGGPLGELDGPTPIRDLTSGAVIR